MANIVRHFMNHVVPGVVRPLHVLWNEIIGFFFLVFAAWFGCATFRGFRNLDKPAEACSCVFVSGCRRPADAVLRRSPPS